MLRQTALSLNWRAHRELQRARPLLRGRAKHEYKLGFRAVTMMMTKMTRFRVLHRQHGDRARVRANVDAAAIEHGTGWAHIRNDIARQNVAILPRMQQHLAQYEPLAFRAMLELCSSRIVPPPSVNECVPIIPTAALAQLRPDADLRKEPSPAAALELEEAVALMLRRGSKALAAQKVGAQPSANAATWLESWRDFQSVPAAQRVTMSK